MIYKALKDASNPDVSTLASIQSAREALKLFWWVDYCEVEWPS